MKDRASTLSVGNSDDLNLAELTDQNFFDKLSIGHKLQNFKDQIDEHSMTEFTEQHPGEINFLEESKLDPNQAFEKMNKNILAGLSQSRSDSRNSKILNFCQSDGLQSEDNSPRRKHKNKRNIMGDSGSENYSKKDTFEQSMKCMSQELRHLRPLRGQVMENQRDSHKDAGIPRIERASTLGYGSKKRTWAGKLTLKYVDNPSIGILDLSNRSRSFGRIKNKIDSPINEDKNLKKKNKTASKIKRISGYQNKEEGAFLMKEMMEKKKISKKKKKKKIKKISKMKDKNTRKKSKKNENHSKNDLADGILIKSKIKSIQRSPSQKKKIKDKNIVKKSTKNSKIGNKLDKKVAEKRKIRNKSQDRSKKHEKNSIHKFEKHSNIENLEIQLENNNFSHKEQNLKANFEIYAGKFQNEERSSLEQALHGYQKNLKNGIVSLEQHSGRLEQTKRNDLSRPYEQHLIKITDKIKMENENRTNQEIQEQRNYICQLKNQIFQIEQSSNELKEYNTYLSRIYKDNSSLEELRGSELKIAHEKIFELISQIKKRDEILERVFLEKQNTENEKNSCKTIFQEHIRELIEKNETKERIAKAVKREFDDKNEELMTSESKNQDLVREIEIFEAIVEKYKEKEKYQESLEKQNAELEAEIESLRTENRKIKHGMKVCGFIKKENQTQIQSDNEENDEYFNRVEQEGRGHQRAMLAMAQEHDQQLNSKNQEIRLLRDEIQNIRNMGSHFDLEVRENNQNGRIMFVKEKGTQTQKCQEPDEKSNDGGSAGQANLISKIQSELVYEMKEIISKVHEKIAEFGILRESENLKIILKNFMSDYSYFGQIISKISKNPIPDTEWTAITSSLTQHSILCKSSLSEAKSCLEVWLATLHRNFDNLQIQTDRFAEEVAELSSRNQVINQELDKIMDQLPKSQKAREEELRKVHKELREEKRKLREIRQTEVEPMDNKLKEYKEILEIKQKKLHGVEMMKKEIQKMKGVETEKKQMEKILKQIQQEVLPSLRHALDREKQKSRELDQVISQMNGEMLDQQRDTEKVVNIRQGLSTQILHVVQVLREIKRHRPRWYVERVPSYLHQSSFAGRPSLSCRATQTLPPTMQSGDLHESSKKTELKQKLNCSESFQEMRTVSTNKEKPLQITPPQSNLELYSKILNIKKKGKAQVCLEQSSKREIILETLQKQLINANQKIRTLERYKNNFKKCRRCLVENRVLLEEEKKKLIVGLNDRRQKWKREKGNQDQNVFEERGSQGFSPEMSKVLFQSKGGAKQILITKYSPQDDFFRNLRDRTQKTEGSEPLKGGWGEESQQRVMSESSLKGVASKDWGDGLVAYNTKGENRRIKSRKGLVQELALIEHNGWDPQTANQGLIRPTKIKTRKNSNKRRKKMENSVKSEKGQTNFKQKDSRQKEELKIGLQLEHYLHSKLQKQSKHSNAPSPSLEADMFQGFLSMPKGFPRSKRHAHSKDKHSKEISTQRKNSRTSYKTNKNEKQTNMGKKKSLEPNTNKKNLQNDRKKRIKSVSKNRKPGSRDTLKGKTQRVIESHLKNPKTRKNGAIYDFYVDSQFNSDLYALISQNSGNLSSSGNRTGNRKDSRNKKHGVIDSKSSKGSLSKKKKSKSKKRKSKSKLKIKTHKNLDFRAILDKSQIRKMIQANFKSRDQNDAKGN